MLQLVIPMSQASSQLSINHLDTRADYSFCVPANHPSHSHTHLTVTNAGESGDEDENDASDHGDRRPRATRNSKSQGDPKPSQLGFYSGPWVDVLVQARNRYRKHIHTTEPFPERTTEKLKDVRVILLEEIGEYKDKGFDIDDSKS